MVNGIIQKRGVAPEHLLISTFTQKAARELLTRLSNRLLEIGSRINLNTLAIGILHSVCLELLAQAVSQLRVDVQARGKRGDWH